MNTQLAKNFTLDEFTRSQTATRHNIPMHVEEGSEVYKNLSRLAGTLQLIRDHFGSVIITSGYRPLALNKRIGGSKNSAHIYGLAADIIVPGKTPFEVATWIANSSLKYDQLIHEYGKWVHVALPHPSNYCRQQNLTAYKKPRLIGSPKTAYIKGIHKMENLI